MKKKLSVIVMSVLLALVLFGCTYNENLLIRKDFSYDDTTALKKDWTLKSGGTESSNVFTVSDAALKINTSSAGWAYAAQEVKLANNAYYKITYTYSISSISIYDIDKGSNLSGLYIGFLEDPSFNIGESPDGLVPPHLHNGRQTTNTEVTFYFKTNYITKSTLAIYVGTEDVPVSASVSVSDITIERVRKSAVAKAENPETGKTESVFYDLDSTVYGANTDKNIVFIVLGAVFTLIAGYVAYILIRRSMALEKDSQNKFIVRLRDSKIFALALVAGFAFFIRILISVIATALAGASETMYLGFNVETQAAQALFLGKHGPIYFMTDSLAEFTTKFSYIYSAPQPTPLSHYILSIIGVMSRGSTNPLLVASFLIKLLGILADVGTVILIYVMLEKKTGKITAFLMSAVYAALPMVFSMSAGWGMSDSVMAFLLVLTFYFVLKNNYWAVAGTYFAAFLFSVNAVYLLPIILFYAVNQFISRPKLRIPMIISLVGALLLFYAVNVPFNYLEIKGGKAFSCVANYFNAVFKGNNVYAANSFNFQGLLKNNFKEISTESTFITILFDVFIFALVGVGYFKNKNRMELPLLGAFLMAMLYSFTNRMTPVTMFMVLPLIFVYAGMAKEKRVYFIGIMYAALMFVNASYVFMVHGYTSSGWAQLGYDNAMIYVFSVFNLLLTLYFVYVVYDIVAARKAAKIKPLEVSYLTWVKSTGYRLKNFFMSFSKSIKG